jgi:hypothetical protein
MTTAHSRNGDCMHDEPRYPIRVVVRRTGLSPHAIWVWERRHGAVTPLSERYRRHASLPVQVWGLSLYVGRLQHVQHRFGLDAVFEPDDAGG